MLIFPSADVPPPFSVTATGRVVGFVAQAASAEARVPVYSAGELSFTATPAVMVLSPRITHWSNPGMALVLPPGSADEPAVAALSVMHPHDAGYAAILAQALPWGRSLGLLVWDAEQWRRDLLAFGEARSAQLAEVPVRCLQTMLGAQGPAPQSLTDACRRFGHPAPGDDLLAQAYSVRRCWNSLSDAFR